MELITIPHALFIFYGALVLACGGGLGFILGRNTARRVGGSDPEPPAELERRVLLLEEELDLTRSELERFRDEADFMRELRRASDPDERRSGRGGGTDGPITAVA